MNGLRPSQLQAMVRQYEPRTVLEAIELVRTVIGDLRIGREQAKIFQGGKSGGTQQTPIHPNLAQSQGKYQPMVMDGRTVSPAKGGERSHNAPYVTRGVKVDKKGGSNKAHITCYNCQQKGHYANECSAAKVERVVQDPKVSTLPGRPVAKRMVL